MGNTGVAVKCAFVLCCRPTTRASLAHVQSFLVAAIADGRLAKPLRHLQHMPCTELHLFSSLHHASQSRSLHTLPRCAIATAAARALQCAWKLVQVPVQHRSPFRIQGDVAAVPEGILGGAHFSSHHVPSERCSSVVMRLYTL